MTTSDGVGGTSRRAGVAHWILLAFAGFLGLNIGAALFATLVIFPVWTASPEAAVAWTRGVDEARFFVLVSPVVLVLAIASLVASWRVGRDVRLWTRIAAVLCLLFLTATMTYFVPAQAAMQGDAASLLPAQELDDSLKRWVALNWVRQVVGLLAFGSALRALGLHCTVPRAQEAVVRSPQRLRKRPRAT